MEIYGLEKMSLVDYSGYVACTVFTYGCNFRCPFCHNSSLVTTNAIPKTIDKESFFSFLTKRKGLLDGVCITGGEPTLNRDLPLFIKEIKDMGYSVKLDSNGSNPAMLKDLTAQGLIDYVAMDIKNSPEHYGKTVGIADYDLTKISESVDFLLSNAIPYEFRTTLVKQLHTGEDMESIGRWIKGAPKMFLQEFTDSGDCLTSGLTAHLKTTALEYKAILENYVDKVELRYS